MNPLFKPTAEESKVIESVNSYNLNEFALIRMTETMLDKSIIDASEALRKILFQNQLIDFNSLTPGGAKEYRRGLIIKGEIIETKVSFYRPKTKNGDPRFWLYNLKKYVGENELVYLTIVQDTLIAIPLTSVKAVQGLLVQVFEDPEQERTIVHMKKDLAILRQIGALESVSPYKRAPKDVGLTLERFLGIKVNSLRTPDYLGRIELKSKREGKTKDSLFSKVQDKEISKYKTVRDVVLRFGTKDKLGRIALKNNITTIPNTHGLYLVPDSVNMIMYQRFCRNKIHDDVCGWHYDTLKNALETKHPATLWVDAYELEVDGRIYFDYYNFELTTKPLFSEFVSLVERDIINFDWKAHIVNGKRRDHGPGFRIDKTNRKLLFKTLIKI